MVMNGECELIKLTPEKPTRLVLVVVVLVLLLLDLVSISYTTITISYSYTVLLSTLRLMGLN